MDFSDLARRFAALIDNRVEIRNDGVARISPAFEQLHQDVKTALQGSPNNENLLDIANGMDMMKEMLSDPEFAMSVTQPPAETVEPQPEIFDAIEDAIEGGNLASVRDALKTWDINQRFGEFDATALYHAMSCMFGFSIELVDFLLDAGADPRKGLADSNVLHGLGFARLDGIDPAKLARVIRRCADGGADINQITGQLQWTPLIYAVSEWNPVATEALLLAGADINIRAGDTGRGCFSGASCMDFAEGHDETVAVLNRFSRPN
ncbi:hypothetical protein [Marimonas arenosa]|uniref:Ankyrin repeat protein n=1 Tax=Marimonas arenosa TaxID=1795305 RepID=A0AAE3WCY0_9RHOB|nr:hypothetical protein [Marimonas arenosa]MDQ2090203.1 hypothetical protein [Marimonas arenosa]